MENSGDNNSRRSWFDVRVFYVRITSNINLIDDSTPECLTVNHIPLSSDTLLQVNGGIMYSESESEPGSVATSHLIRRSVVVVVDHHMKKTKEATFVSTDSIRFTGSVRFEVFSKDEQLIILSGVIEMTKTNTWNMECEDVMVVTAGAGGNGFLKQHESLSAEVFVAGSFSGLPVILTKTVRIRKKNNNIRMKKSLYSIPEFETSYHTTTTTAAVHKPDLIHHHLQVVEYGSCNDNKTEGEEEEKEEECNNRNSLYCGERFENYYYMEGSGGGEDDGELSWFNDGVRVGVGIGLGICLGLGVGVGLLVRSYQATTRNFKRRFPNYNFI